MCRDWVLWGNEVGTAGTCPLHIFGVEESAKVRLGMALEALLPPLAGTHAEYAAPLLPTAMDGMGTMDPVGPISVP